VVKVIHQSNWITLFALLLVNFYIGTLNLIFEVKRNVSLTNKSSLNVKYYWYKENYKTTYGRYGYNTRLIIKSRLRLDFTISQPRLLDFHH
jgi:hypothetical protein